MSKENLTESQCLAEPVSQFKDQIEWTLLVCLAFSVLIMFFPLLFGIHGLGAISIYVAGALSFAGSMVSGFTTFRTPRFLNLFSSFLLVSWFFGQATGTDRWLAFLIGITLGFFCIYGGKEST